MNHGIEFERNRKDLTGLSGLVFFRDLVLSLGLSELISSLLPKKLRKSGISSASKFLTGIYGFICGAECIADLDQLGIDPLFSKITKPLSSTAMGKFLFKFELKQIQKLQNFLPVLCLLLRFKLNLKGKIILAMDATHHKQHGEYMEGVEYSDFKKMNCLSSQNLFDQYGFCYDWSLRSGTTHTSIEAVQMLSRVLPKLNKEKKEVEFIADSGYATGTIFDCLITNNTNFAICLPEPAWGPLLDKNEFRMSFKKTKINFFDSNKCQIGSCLYTPKKLKTRGFLRVVFIRAKRKRINKEDKRYFDYYAIATTFSEKEKSDEEIIRYYRKRANCENFIKDLKYGMDFLHFPSGKLNANRAWGLIGIIAYNLIRYASLILFPGRGCFLKRVRQNLLYIPAEIANHARKIKLKFSNYYYREVKRIRKIFLNRHGFYHRP